jgi:tRNA(Ile)-lysidine synthase
MTVMAPTTAKKGIRRAWPALLHRVVGTIRSNRLIEPGQHVLVGVSGGPDSVALLSLLHRLRASWCLSLTAAHFNYGLRGRESDEDERFVTELCRGLDVPLSVMALDVRHRVRGTSLQAAARDLRYRAMADMAEKERADRIAVGHTADDQAETVLLWMLRGAGLRGLSGMPVSRDGTIVRPLYDSPRREVLEYLAQAGLSYREDSTNATQVYARNRVRQELLPVLKRLQPSGVQALCRLADLCREDDRYLDAQTAALSAERIHQEREGVWVVERAFVQQLPPALQRRLVREMLRRCDDLQRAPTARSVEQVMQAVKKKGPGQHLLTKRVQVLIDGQAIRLVAPGQSEATALQHAPPTLPVAPPPSAVHWAGTDQTIRIQRLARERVHDTAPSPGRIVVDGDRVSGPLTIRTWQRGDRFHPWGMKGRSKKLQDYFTDLKVPAAARNIIPIVVAPEGLVWIVGYRQDERWAVTPRTRHCLVLTAIRDSTGEGAL